VDTSLREYVSFLDDETPVPEQIPDDSPPPGRILAETLARSLQIHGLEVTHPVTEFEGYGWEFTVSSAGRSIRCVLQASDAWLLMTEVRRTWVEKIGGRHFPDAHQRVLDALRATLESGGRFNAVQWYTPDEWQHGTGSRG
jgi:hypothetical protein